MNSFEKLRIPPKIGYPIAYAFGAIVLVVGFIPPYDNHKGVFLFVAALNIFNGFRLQRMAAAEKKKGPSKPWLWANCLTTQCARTPRYRWDFMLAITGAEPVIAAVRQNEPHTSTNLFLFWCCGGPVFRRNIPRAWGGHRLRPVQRARPYSNADRAQTDWQCWVLFQTRQAEGFLSRDTVPKEWNTTNPWTCPTQLACRSEGLTHHWPAQPQLTLFPVWMAWWAGVG